MDKLNTVEELEIPSTPSSSKISPKKFTITSPSAHEIRQNRNTIIKVLDTLKTLSQIRSKHELIQRGTSPQCLQCPCTQRGIVEADIKYLQGLMVSQGFQISRADCVKAYQNQDMVKFAAILQNGLIKIDGLSTKKRKLEASTTGAESDATITAKKLEAALKAVHWMENKSRSQYSFDSSRSEFSVVDNATKADQVKVLDTDK